MLAAPARTAGSGSEASSIVRAARDSTGAWDPRGLHEALEAEADGEARAIEEAFASAQADSGSQANVTPVEFAVPRVPLPPLASDSFVLSREDAMRMLWTDSICAWGECPSFRAPEFYD